ncbi:tetratricopeptide repeat protein [Methylomicrobium sp. Wu6]|uniref:tetratricopeptide repeat protein n=1 Tax=Methylomicrobium sp. Wu6 TaxID=3107928 RepID=UPI002DD66EC5|nr:tetratricopeptide repeat protein [Methylomicrobium sp. Wu6]MEC4750068.1 tetratricopeptide repeat protein [Methylomicrobium sp. Wu6]
MLIFRLFAVLALILLNGCASSPEKPQEPVTPAASAQSIKKELPKQSEAKTEIDQDVLFMLMSAEIAGQRGQYELAYEGYIEAAKRVKDPKPAERAAMIAMYLKDAKKLKKSLALWLKKEPRNLTARKLAVLTSLKDGDQQKTQEHLAAILDSDPAGFESAVLEIANALQSEGKLPVVYDSLEALSVKKPDQAIIYYLQSIIAMQMKNQDLAEKKVEQALKFQPDWDKALAFQAQIAVLSGDLPKAVGLLRNVHLKYPDNQKISKMLTQLLIKTGEYDEAGKVYQALVEKDPKDFESWLALALVDMQLDRDNEAERILKKLLDENEWREQARFYLGKLEEKRDNIKKALNWYDQVRAEPFNFEAGVAAVNLLAHDKQYDEAISRLESMQDSFPKERIRITLMKAELLNQQKHYQEAYDVLTAALSEQPDSKELLYTRALLAERIDKLDVLESDLKKILAQSPDNPEALNALGYTLLSFPARLDEAEKYLLHALRLQPNEPVILDSYGWLLFKQGHAQKALEYLQRAYAKQRENEIAAHIAEVLWALGRKDEARQLFDKAIKAAPDDEYLLDFKQRILNRAE